MKILGMAKSSLDLNGAKRQKLELNCLQLIYAVRKIRDDGELAQAYLCVMTESIANTVDGWCLKYEAPDVVTSLVADTNPLTRALLIAEKLRNTQGMIRGSQGKAVGESSNADAGRQLGESELERQITLLYPGISRIADESKFPLGLSWDYFGEAESPREDVR